MAPTDPDGRPPRSGIKVPWSRSDRFVPRRVVRPLQEFLQTSTSSGILLVIAAVVALVWINSPVGDTYERVWTTKVFLGIGGRGVSEDLRSWVNDGLMALFFLVVGLEIKRELVAGELRDRRAAALPAIAAVGGMVVPALIYLAMNVGGEGARGWGIVMPTDIAFTLGILALASRHAPPGIRSFVLTLAIVDDVLTFVVIAIVYPTELSTGPLLLVATVGAAMLVMERMRVRSSVVYVALGIAMWGAMHASGVPPALAGVVVGLLTPIGPLTRLEHALLPWTSFVILPVFALANAGVSLSADAIGDALRSPVAAGIVVGRVAGKTLGIWLAVWLVVRLGVGRLPEGSRSAHVVGVAAAAGVAFTVSLFVAGLAFAGRPELVQPAKVGILACAPIAGVAGYVLLRKAGADR